MIETIIFMVRAYILLQILMHNRQRSMFWRDRDGREERNRGKIAQKLFLNIDEIFENSKSTFIYWSEFI